MTNLLTKATKITAAIEKLMATRTEHVTAVADIDAKVEELRNDLALATIESQQPQFALTGESATTDTKKKKPVPSQRSLNFNYQQFTPDALVIRMKEVYPEFLRLHADWKNVKNSVWTKDCIKQVIDLYNVNSPSESVGCIVKALNRSAKGKAPRVITPESVTSRISTLMLYPEANTNWTAMQISGIERLASGGADVSVHEFAKIMAQLAQTGSPVDSIFCYIRGATNRIATEGEKRSLKKVTRQFSKQKVQID